ncbi:S-adenosylmethionine decarboxylase [Phellopilus nigrolimitatus]|nr:S-adenosylmethionine decarboxylase [Phellopilus nigrolimitatus]
MERAVCGSSAEKYGRICLTSSSSYVLLFAGSKTENSYCDKRSESSLFISPHRLILKTCGTTLNLLGLPRILAVAKEHAKLSKVYQCFYSRKAFMFPDRQLGPHKDWSMEIGFLDKIFDHGSAYTVGKVNGDHWLLYMTNPEDLSSGSGTELSSLASSIVEAQDDNWAIVGQCGLYTLPLLPPTQDYTIEILMTHLSARARAAFFTPDAVDPCEDNGLSPSIHAQQLSSELGISDIFPRPLTQLDAYSFVPCGYSSNALIKWNDTRSDISEKNGEGYYTIHVTPEEGFSYASFECNVPLAVRKSGSDNDNSDDIPDLRTLVQRIVRIFEPGKLTMTLFVASAGNESMSDDDGGETAVEAAQRAFKGALTRIPKPRLSGNSINGESSMNNTNGGLDKAYKRTDKINYEFGGYDLAFASFEMI